MGISAVILGTIIYASIKVAGYSFFAKYLNALFNKQQNIWKVGLTRTVLGVALGLAHNALFFTFFDISMGRSPIGGDGTPLYFLFLVLLRIIEWGLIIYWFYDKPFKNKTKTFKAITLGILCSFILDIPMLMGLFVVIASIC